MDTRLLEPQGHVAIDIVAKQIATAGRSPSDGDAHIPLLHAMSVPPRHRRRQRPASSFVITTSATCVCFLHRLIPTAWAATTPVSSTSHSHLHLHSSSSSTPSSSSIPSSSSWTPKIAADSTDPSGWSRRTLIDHSSRSLETLALQARATTNEIVNDKYFIPAIATIGALVLLSIMCFWWLGWCFNRQRMDSYYTRRALPTAIHSVPQTAPQIPSISELGRSARTIAPGTTPTPAYRTYATTAKRQSIRKDRPDSRPTSPASPTSPPGHQQQTSGDSFNAAALYTTGNAQLHPSQAPYKAGYRYSYTNTYINQPQQQQQQQQPLGMGGIPSSYTGYSRYNNQDQRTSAQGFQAFGAPENANLYYAYADASRGLGYGDRGQNGNGNGEGMYAAGSAAATRGTAPASAAPRTSVLSTESSTQIGSGGGGPQTLYSPHDGNTLSYASSTVPSEPSPAEQAQAPPLPLPPQALQLEGSRPAASGIPRPIASGLPQESYRTAQTTLPGQSSRPGPGGQTRSGLPQESFYTARTGNTQGQGTPGEAEGYVYNYEDEAGGVGASAGRAAGDEGRDGLPAYPEEAGRNSRGYPAEKGKQPWRY